MRFYRVHPAWPSAPSREKGHPLYATSGGGGRVCNAAYPTLYVADSPSGAIAEAFGTYGLWESSIFLPPVGTPSDSQLVLTTYDGQVDVVNLDDPVELSALGIGPSRVVTRNRTHTQAWALALFQLRGGSGVRWWSYYDPDWGSYGLWDTAALSVVSSEPLTVDSPSVLQAAAILNRPISRV